MAIQKETILEFQKVVKKVYDREVTFEQASEIVHGLVGYFSILAKMNHKIETTEKEG